MYVICGCAEILPAPYMDVWCYMGLCGNFAQLYRVSITWNLSPKILDTIVVTQLNNKWSCWNRFIIRRKGVLIKPMILTIDELASAQLAQNALWIGFKLLSLGLVSWLSDEKRVFLVVCESQIGISNLPFLASWNWNWKLVPLWDQTLHIIYVSLDLKTSCITDHVDMWLTQLKEA